MGCWKAGRASEAGAFFPLAHFPLHLLSFNRSPSPYQIHLLTRGLHSASDKSLTDVQSFGFDLV